MGTLLNNNDAANSSELHFFSSLIYACVIECCSKRVEIVHA